MKVLLSWLRDFAPFEGDPIALGEEMSDLGMAVEELDRMGEGLDGVAIYNPDAKLIGRILLPERCANLCFGGAKRNRLFLAASQSLYSIFVNTQGVAGG